MIDIGIKSTFRAHRFVGMIQSDVMEELPLTQERGNNGIEMGKFRLRKGKAGMGIIF